MTHREYDQPAIVEDICEAIAGGKSLSEACRRKGMPTVRTWLRWAEADQTVGAEYHRALQARAEFFAAEHDRIRKTSVDRDTASAARVQLSALEWMMGRMAPRRYGDRVDVDVKADQSIYEVMMAAEKRLRDAEEADRIAMQNGDSSLPKSLLECSPSKDENSND